MSMIPPSFPGAPDCVASNPSGGGNGLCFDYEVVCFDAGPSPLLLFTIVDCDPTSATFGQLVQQDYRDPNNPTLVVAPTGVAVACPNNIFAIDVQQLCDDNGPFLQALILNSTNGAVIGAPISYTVLGAPYAPIGAVAACPDWEHVDHMLIDSNGPFIRRITLLDGVPTSVDYLLDGTTPYVAILPITIPEFDHIVLCDVDPNGVATPFIRVIGFNGLVISGLDPISGGPYTPTGTVEFCDSRQLEQITLCEYDPTNGIRIGEFIRRWVLDTSDNSVVSGPSDFELDGVTPYVVGATTVTRNCENEVGCTNDPCTLGTAPIVSNPVLNGPTPAAAVTNLQIDQPASSNGLYKIDIFEDDFTPLAGIGIVPSLVTWLQSGPGGQLPPSDEVFVWDGMVGLGPTGPVQGGPNVAPWTAPNRLVIPGWMVINWANVSTNPSFLELRFDTNIVNPQNCPLQGIDVPGLGITLDVLIASFTGALDTAIAATGPGNAIGGGPFDAISPFVIGTAAAADTIDIYAMASTEAVQATSVVLCQTVTSRVVCFSGEPEPLISVEGINSDGQTVFGPVFKRQGDGAILTPVGSPVECGSNSKYETVCGDCSIVPVSQTAAGGLAFNLALNNSSPISHSMVITETTNLNIVPAITAFLQTADPRDIFTVNTVQGPFPWIGSGVPMVIPRWLVRNFSVSTTQVGIDLDDSLLHPDDCPLPVSYTNWITNRFTPGFLSWGAGTPQVINIVGASRFEIDSLGNFDGGPALRVVDCCQNVQTLSLCDNVLDGSSVPFLRNLSHSCDGVVTVEADYDINGGPYVVQGTIGNCNTAANGTCLELLCTGTVVGPATSYAPGAGAPTDVMVSASAAAPYTVTLSYPSDPTLIADFLSCTQSGGYFQFRWQTFFGTIQYLIGGVGLSNVSSTATSVTFTFDPAASIADINANCPASIVPLVGLLTSTINSLNILQFFPTGLGATGVNGFCINQVFSEANVPAQRVSICNTPSALRTARVQDVTNNALDIDLLNATSFEFVVLSGVSVYDGVTFTVGQGAGYGDDGEFNIITGATLITAPSPADSFRITYTEIA